MPSQCTLGPESALGTSVLPGAFPGLVELETSSRLLAKLLQDGTVDSLRSQEVAEVVLVVLARIEHDPGRSRKVHFLGSIPGGRLLGWQMGLRWLIFTRHHGELVVGTAEVVETGHERIPYLIAAPTMRVPMILHDSVNAYLAARASLLLVQHGAFASGEHQGQPVAERVKSIAFPGLGTGVGQIGFNTCARQVRSAIDDVLLGKYRVPQSWAEASERHQLLYTDRVRSLQHDR